MSYPNKFYNECVVAFEKFRRKDYNTCSNYISRLSLTLDKLTSLEGRQYNDKENQIQNKKSKYFRNIKRIRLSIHHSLKFFLYKRERLIDLLKTSGENYVAVLCFASTRNPINIQSGNVRNQINKWLKNFENSDIPPNIKKLTSGGLLCLVDVAETDWNKDDLNLLKNEGIIILNDKILVARFLQQIVIRPFKTVSEIIYLIKSTLNHKVGGEQLGPSRSMMFAFELFRLSFDSEFDRVKYIEACLITSNSALAESLRFFLLNKNLSGNTVCEISHGINNYGVDEYIRNICELENKYYKRSSHVFIEQIPGLPKYGTKMNNLVGNGQYALNIYLNRYFSSYEFKHDVFKNKMFELLNNISQDNEDSCNLIVNFIGYTDHNKNLTSQLSFIIECCLMEKVINTAKSQGKNISLVYSAHPATDYEKLSEQRFFKDNKIILSQSTLSMYFLADLSVGLLSSSVFEASYFGSSVLLPMTLSDEIYPMKFLNLFYYPATIQYEHLDKTVENWMFSRIPLSKTDKKNDIVSRIKKYGAWE